MNLLGRLGGVLDSLWSAIDPDEPLLCSCTGAATCPDCALGAPMEATGDWATPSATA